MSEKTDRENNDDEIDSIERDEFLSSYNPKEDNANSYYWHFDVCRALRDYRDKYISDFKSSLKRDIEKRIAEHRKYYSLFTRREDDARLLELQYFLELIETVEP